MRSHSTTGRRCARLLEALIEPPSVMDAGQRWFNLDLTQLDRANLREEAQRLRLRLLLTPRAERSSWPATWVVNRLDAIDELLRIESAAAAWARVGRK